MSEIIENLRKQKLLKDQEKLAKELAEIKAEEDAIAKPKQDKINKMEQEKSRLKIENQAYYRLQPLNLRLWHFNRMLVDPGKFWEVAKLCGVDEYFRSLDANDTQKKTMPKWDAEGNKLE